MTRQSGSAISSAKRLAFVIALLTVLTGPADSKAQDQKPAKPSTGKQIAITFDELPAALSFGEVDANAITYMILEALRKHEITATGFVVGLNIDGQYDLLGDWLNEGHGLGTMTYSNQDIEGLSTDQFMQEIQSGQREIEEMLVGFGQKARYFRYPFLHYGTDPKTKTKIRDYLAGVGNVVAHASVVPDDFTYDLAMQKFGKVPDSAQYERLLNEYVNHVIDQIERSEDLAEQLVGRPVKQILRLRANRLNATYLDDMLTALEDEGYSFVTLGSALRDPVYAKQESYFGSRGVGYLDMLYVSKKKAGK
ncbi:MAG: polysaccharide deacetylase family protein [Candidatus Zixiibacteriota bacterium]